MGSAQQALLIVGGGTAPFSPSDVSGLTLWLKADAITGKSDGDLIDQWDDSSGNGFHVTAAGGLRPTYKVNIENGLPAVLFSGAQYLTGTQRQNLVASNTYAIFVVGKVADLSLAANQFFFADLGSRLILYTSTAGNLRGFHTDGLGGFDLDGGAGTDGAVFILDMRHDEGYGPGDSRRHQVKRSGGTAAVNSAIGPLTATGATDTTYIGGRSGVSRFLTGHILEVVIYNSSVSDANRSSIRDYLAGKYGFVYS